MRIIYSFDTKGGRISPTPFFRKMAELSVCSAKKIGLPVVLYADLYGINYFRQNGFQFDEYCLMDPDKYEVDFKYWNFGKLLAYSMQKEAFLHVDFDTFFHDGFSIPEHGDIITEMLRPYSLVKPFTEISILDTNKIPEKLICSGLLGGYNIDVFKELFDHAVQICQKQIKDQDKTMAYLVGVEEFNISLLSQFYGLSVEELDHNTFDHWQGGNKEKNYGTVINELYNIYCKKDEKSI